MRLGRELVAILYIVIFLVGDPQILRACSLEKARDAAMRGGGPRMEFFAGSDASQIRLSYELNGGINHNANKTALALEELPMRLEVPVRDGYNFAGWYSDCSYTEKITSLEQGGEGSMVLFAKWTKAVNSRSSVERYSYRADRTAGKKQKELKECSYRFLEEVSIPGMPSTREKDCLENIISSSGQCLQGICFTPELLLISAYAESKQEAGSLMAFDRESGAYLATLAMKKESHLGGIAFDGENVWVCHSNSKTLERIPYEYVLKIARDAPGYCVDASALSDEYKLENIPSCITFYGGRIWVATHTKYFESMMFSYRYDGEEDCLEALSAYRIPSKVQGVDFGGDGAVYLSTSYGRKNSSYLKAYRSLLALDSRPENPAVKVEMPPCSEEVAVLEDDIYILFESASEKYFEGTDGIGTSSAPIDKVLEVSMDSIWRQEMAEQAGDSD